ncbi:MAG: TRAP transporter substrate-binding protein DctP [Proteobacteria bacterium]|nr:TRAP transporter substrate-binding protein DctP [Pseudomonadota bacterium]
MENDNNRRKFIKNVGIGAAALGTAGLAGVLSSCKDQKQEEKVVKEEPKAKTIEWKMVTTWPPHFPMLGESADKIAQWVDEMSDGRLKISVYGGGELVPPLGVFDAVSEGTVQMGHGAAYYWAGKAPAAQFFAAVPFGFNAQSLNAWLYSGGGMQIWEELYAQFNLKPFVAGNTGVQMGGWFNKEINTMEDLKGLKMRIPGLGGKVLAKAGGNAVLVAGGEIYTNLERGVIDATEWVGPFHDLKLGFHKAAKYYYYPGWHELGTGLEAMVNLDAWNTLPNDLKAIVEAATYKSNMWMLSEFEAKNNAALRELIDVHKVQLKEFPEPVLKELKRLSFEVLEEVAASDPMSRKVYDSFLEFQKNIYEWNKITEEPYQKLKYL